MEQESKQAQQQAQAMKYELEKIWQKLEESGIGASGHLRNKSSLIAVSKTFPFEAILEAYKLGQRDFGENRLQELEIKAQKAQESGKMSDIRWHFIGNIQSNKIKGLLKVPHLYALHAVSSEKVIKLLFKEASVLSREIKKIGLFFQVNTSGEEEKSGIESLEELTLLIDSFKKLKENEENQKAPFSLEGLMTIGKIRTDDFVRDAHLSFKKLADLAKNFPDLNLGLSMGMSQDYEIALQYGADYIRVGSQIFGHRNYSEKKVQED